MCCARCGFSGVGNCVGLAAFLALPSVILVLIFAQTRIFFVMSRDGLLPEGLSQGAPKWKTPHVVTIITGLIVAFGAAFFPVGQLADYRQRGYALCLPDGGSGGDGAAREGSGAPAQLPLPLVWVVAPLTIIGCVLPVLQPAD